MGFIRADCGNKIEAAQFWCDGFYEKSCQMIVAQKKMFGEKKNTIILVPRKTFFLTAKRQETTTYQHFQL